MLNTLIARLFGRHVDPTPCLQRTTQRRGRRQPSMVFEPLEPRLLLSAGLIGIPDWIDNGAAPMTGAQVSVPPGDFATGAVESVAVNPANSAQIYVGTVNGGIWRTNNADPTNPDATTWTPLTDQMPSLAMGDISFSPLDASGNTLFAGTGSFSSLSQSGGPAIGILRTTDGGATWNNFAVSPAGESQIKAVLPTAIDLDPGAGVQGLVLVGTVGGGGLFRSNDNGQTFNLLSSANGLPAGDISQLVVDPNNAQRFYAGIPSQGVFRGDFNAGTGVITWAAVNTGITNIGNAGNVQVAARNSASTTVLFALLSDNTTSNPGAFRSTDSGANWAPLADPPALFARDVTVRAGNTIVIDPTNDQVAYIATYGGGDDIFRYNPAGAGSWDVIDNAGALGGTNPHADARDLVFQSNDTLIETNDGGIYFIRNPLNSAANAWQSYIGGGGTGLGDVEFHNIAWDGRFDVIVGGSQDNGSEVQTATGSKVWDHFQGGDGGDVQVDSVSLGGAAQSIRYVSTQNLGSFNRVVADSATNIVQNVSILPGGGLANFTGTFVPHYELNVLAPAANTSKSIAVGGGGTSPVYIGTMPDVVNSNADVTWTAVPVGAGFGTANALAFGGMRGGVANADVLYAGTGGGVFVRSTAGGTLTATTTAFPGGGVSDLALDPNDWQHIFVASASGVWESTDAGANWTNRTGNLVNSNIQTIEYAEAGAVDTVLVGAQGGVFRMVTSSPGVWSEFGQHLPNAVVFDLDYDYGDDIVVAGTFGRGAWVVEDARDTLTLLGVLQIYGDDDFSGQDDTIRLIRNAANPSLLDVSINTDFFQFQLSTIQQINVDSLGGKDTLIVDSTNGLITVQNGIRYDGGAGSDALQLLQTGGAQRTSDTYSVGPGLGQGLSVIVGAGTAGTQTVNFDNLEPVLDLVPAALLTVNATGGDNAINFTQGGLVTNGKVSIDAYETIEFSNKVALVINALAGSDAIGINNAATPTALTTITINGGDPGVGDSLSLTSTGAAVSVNTATASITGATGAGGAVGVNYSGIEALALGGAIGTLAFTTTGADDALNVTPGASGAANSGTLVASGVVPSISFSNNGAITANLGAGNDTATVNGSALADTFAVGSAAVVITGRNAVNLTGAESVIVNGGAGSDIFNVTPAASVAFFIDGGDPVGILPGDLLAINSGAQTVTFNAGPQTDEGSFGVGANAPVSFDHIESFAINGTGPAVINGTNGPDSITVIARDASTHGAANGVQDFTVSVNSGPELLFINVTSLTVNALAGSDEVALTTPAPNGAVWDVDVAINGGEPTAVGDRLVVSTPGAGAETAVYTPNAADGGVLDLTSLSSPVVISQIETLVYDGQNDGDTLTVLGGIGADVIVHSPGATDQAGTLAVNALLAISYQNLGALALVRADGLGGADTLVLNGTALNDSLSVDAAALVGLNTRLKVGALNIETLTLEGLAGDDVFTLVPEMALSPFAVINFNGGAQASAAGDRMVLVGGASNDAFVITGQTVILGTKTVNGSGVERTSLDAKGGANSITYNGVLGTSEAITFASSGVPGGGQLSVPGVTLVDFSNVQTLEAVGNVPGSTETDTLAFSGTNAVDVFSINMAALGTDGDPFLKLLPATGNTPLLTLRNYSNFETLRINGLDGADTFNVYTSDAGIDRAILIDGGSPTAKKKSTDNLNVYYTPSRPRIIQSAATQNPGSGLVDLAYTNRRFLVQYADMEQIVIARGVKP